MRNLFFRIFSVVAVLLCSITVPGADYPSLPAASSIRKGKLDNGITYYIVPNSAEKGMADICLVQKGGCGMEDGETAGASSVHVMETLTELPHFRQDSPYDFLSRNHIWPGPEGYAEVGQDAVTYRFRNLNLSRSKEMVDSVLLLVFDIISREPESFPGRYSPANQAIIVAGDVDAAAVLGKMNMLSMLVSRSAPASASDKYSWQNSNSPEFRLVSTSRTGCARLTVEYASPRTAEDRMNTILPLISRRYSYELEIILRRRLSSSFRAAGIPVSGLNFAYFGSSAGSGDEKTCISVDVLEKDLYSAASVMASVLAGLDADGASVDEYRDAHNELLMNLRRKYTGDSASNSEYVGQCRSAYLYGSSLASAKSVLDFFLSKSIDDSQGVRFFNGYVSALLDKSKNLTIECRADSSAVSGKKLLRTFDLAWKPAASKAYSVSYIDTLHLKKTSQRQKVKLRTEETEPVYGGKTWVFDNGIRVIFKQVAGSGSFHYMWLLKGGYSLMTDLKPGEGACISDMLGLYSVSDLSCYAFSDMLSANGISFGAEVTMSDLRISGAAPVSRLNVLLKSLYALTSDRAVDKSAYDYYRKCLKIGMSAGPSPASSIDSLLFPGNGYSAYRRPQSLADDFQTRAEKFFEKEFSKMNDGVLILVGDFDEFALKKDLSYLLGGFDTEKVSSYRSRARYQPGVGKVSETRVGNIQDIELGLSAPLTYSVENYMASGVAGLALEDKIKGCLAASGWNASSESDFEMFPDERYTFTVSASMSKRTGLPGSMLQNTSPEDVLYGLQKSLASFKLNASELKIYKASLANRLESVASDPENIVDMLALRYSYLKDVVTKYKDKVNGVALPAVNGILNSLASGRVAGLAVICPPDESEFSREVRLQSGTVAGIPVLTPASDSLGINVAAFRSIGLPVPSGDRYWLDNENFRKFIRTLPEPVPPAPESEPELPVTTDTLAADGALPDSLAGGQIIVDELDSSASASPADSVGTVAKHGTEGKLQEESGRTAPPAESKKEENEGEE